MLNAVQSYLKTGRTQEGRNSKVGGLSGMWMLLLAVVLLIVSPTNMIWAQDTDVLQPGGAVVGTIDADIPSASYPFSGQAGDLVMIGAYGITPGMDPNLTLVGPNGQTLAFNNNETFVSFSTAATIVFRLQETGGHTVVVSGTPGDFFLRLSVYESTQATNLELNSSATVALPTAESGQVFAINTDPSQGMSILFEVNSADAGVQIAVRDATGEAVAVLRNSLANACLSFGPGDERYEITVTSLVQTTGTVTMILSNTSCELGAAPVQATREPTAQFTPVPIEGTCAASSPSNVNIRTGAGTDNSVVALLPAEQPIQVIGQNEDGTWYAVQNESLQGWVAASVVFITGPCDDLPVNPVTEAPMETPEATEEPPAEATEEPTPEITEEPTPEVTPEPTPEATESP
jgi:hypothetical protein